MIKKILQIIFMMVMTGTIIFLISMNTHILYIGNMQGMIITTNPSGIKPGQKAMTIHDLKTGNTTNLSEQLFDSPMFSFDKKKFLGINQDIFADRVSEYIISEYNIDEKISKVIFQKDKSFDVLSDVSYIPNSEDISFVRFDGKANDDRLIRYDIKNKTEEYLLSLNQGYCWNPSGKSVIYNFGEKVYEYFLSTGESKYLCKGYKPRYSGNGKFIAFLQNSVVPSGDNALIVKEIGTDKEWKFKTSNIENFRFSPDEKYIAISKSSSNLLGFFKDIMVFWDFNHDKSIEFMDKMTTDEFDWK